MTALSTKLAKVKLQIYWKKPDLNEKCGTL